MNRAAWLSAIALGACSVEVSLDGKACPCADGYRCDDPVGRCVPDDCTPAASATLLEVRWTTPSSIALRWQSSTPSEDALLGFELVVAENEEDLFARTGTARVIDQDEYPELDAALSDGTSIIRDLRPDTLYVMRVFAIDTAECASGSNVVSIDTPADAHGYLDLFADTVAPPAYTSPPDALRVEEGHLVYHPEDDPECAPAPGADPTCGQPLRVQGLDVGLSQDVPEQPGLQPQDFSGAFVELRLENLGDVPSRFGELSLWLAGCSDASTIYELAGFTLAARPGYQLFQLPLREFLRSEAPEPDPLTFGLLDTQAGGTSVCGFAVGAQWNKTGGVRIDHVRVRY